MSALVTIDRGKHKHPVPKGLAALVEQVLAEHGVHGEYRLRFGPQVRGTPQQPRFKARPLIREGQGLELVLKPGGNDTSCTCWLFPDNAEALSCEALGQILLPSIDPPTVQPAAETPSAPPSPRLMVDVAALEAEVAETHAGLVTRQGEIAAGITDREESIEVLRLEMVDLRAEEGDLAAELDTVAHRLAALRTLREMVG